MNTVLVTGATGLVGSYLCKDLIDKGYKVKALVRESSDKSFLDELGVEYVYSDIRNLEKLKEALNGVDIVFHTAAQVGAVSTYDQEHASTNIQGTRNILEACAYNNVKKFIYVSTLGVLGILRDHYNDDESAPYVKVGAPYYDTKIDSERLVLNYYHDKNLPITVIRPGFIYGPRDRNGLPNIIPYILKGQIAYIGHGNNDIALTSVKNLTKAMILSAESNISNGKTYNITDGMGVSVKQFMKELSNILEINEPKTFIPIPIALGISKAVSALNKDSIFNEFSVALMSNSFNFNISKAKKDLGYKPDTNFEDNLREAVEWYVKSNSGVITQIKRDLLKNKVIGSLGILLTSTLLGLYIKNKIEKSK